MTILLNKIRSKYANKNIGGGISCLLLRRAQVNMPNVLLENTKTCNIGFFFRELLL